MNNNGLIISPKKWIGDLNIIRMDWDAKGMHMHLLCYAYQQEPQGYLLDDEILLRKLLGSPDDEKWNRVKPQIFACWKSKNLIVDGVKQTYIYNLDLLKIIKDNSDTNAITNKVTSTVKEVKKKKGKGVEFDDMPYDGFDLKSIVKFKPTVTILYEKGEEQAKTNIWDLGVKILENHGDNNSQARSFLSRLVKTYGEVPVSTIIAKLSLNQKPIVEIHAYITGMLKKDQDLINQRKRGKSFVI